MLSPHELWRLPDTAVETMRGGMRQSEVDDSCLLLPADTGSNPASTPSQVEDNATAADAAFSPAAPAVADDASAPAGAGAVSDDAVYLRDVGPQPPVFSGPLYVRHPTPPIVLMHIRACVALLDAVGRWF